MHEARRRLVASLCMFPCCLRNKLVRVESETFLPHSTPSKLLYVEGLVWSGKVQVCSPVLAVSPGLALGQLGLWLLPLHPPNTRRNYLEFADAIVMFHVHCRDGISKIMFIQQYLHFGP